MILGFVVGISIVLKWLLPGIMVFEQYLYFHQWHHFYVVFCVVFFFLWFAQKNTYKPGEHGFHRNIETIENQVKNKMEATNPNVFTFLDYE